MAGKRRKKWAATVALLIAAAWAADQLWAGSVTEQVKGTVEEVIRTLKDPRLQMEAKKRERRERLRQIIGARFDFEEMARRSLGQHWQRHAARKREFVPIFTHFVQDSYVGQIEAYRDEKILYLRERLESDFAQVDTKVLKGNGEEIPIHYRLHLVGGQWKIYDVLIENISLVNNYRSQFHRILSSASFDDLLKRLQEKQAESRRL